MNSATFIGKFFENGFVFKQMYKKLFFIPIILSMMTGCQTKESFDCEYFSLKYPNNFIIKDDPNRILFLESSHQDISVLFFENWLKNVDIWDDEAVKFFKEISNGRGCPIISKKIIQTKKGTMKCLVLYDKQNDDNLYNMTTYFFIHEGHLFAFISQSQDNYKYRKYITIIDPEEILKSLKFKSHK